MDRWSKLSLRDKSDLMSLYIQNGVTSLDKMKEHYNSFAKGGNLDEPNDEKPYIPGSEQNYGYLKPVEVTADRPEYMYGLTDYDWTRANSPYYRNNLGARARFIRDVGTKNLTGQSDYMRDVNRLAAISNAAMLGAGVLSGAAFNPYLWSALGLASGIQNIEDKNYGAAALDIGLTLGAPAAKAVNTAIESTKFGKAARTAAEINKAINKTKFTNKEPYLNVGWAPKQDINVYHASNEPLTIESLRFPDYNNWAVSKGAPADVIYLAEGDKPVSGFLTQRPYLQQWKVSLNKPMVQVGEIPTETKNLTRGKLLRQAQSQGADAMIFDGIADNQMKNQRIIADFTKENLNNRASSIRLNRESIPTLDQALQEATTPLEVTTPVNVDLEYGLQLDDYIKYLAEPVEDNYNFIERANKYFYNYPPIQYNDEILRDTEKINQLVKDRIAEHNTFLRGIRDPMSSPHKFDQINAQKLNKKLEELGISPTRENRLKYMATHYAGDTGSGRAGIKNDLFQGALYTSNSLNTAAGYAMSHDLKPVGEIAIVRRPYSLGSDRNQWFKEGDFSLYSDDYGYPQSFHDIIDRSSINKLREQGILSGNLSKKEIGEIYDNVYKGLYKIYDSHVDNINTILKDAGINFLVDKKLKPTEKDLLFAQNLNDKLVRRIPNPIQLHNKQLLFTGLLTSPDNKAFQIVHNPSLRFGIKDETKKQGYRLVRKKEMEKYLPQLNDFVEDRVYTPFSTLENEFFPKETIEFLQHIEPVPLIKSLNKKVYLSKYDFTSSMPSDKNVSALKKNIGFRLHQAIKNKVPDEVYNNAYANFRYLAPDVQISDKPYVFTTENTRISPIGENYQHYIFRGPVGQKALDFIDFVPKDKYVGLDYISRQHTGESLPGISRKTFAYGGKL